MRLKWKYDSKSKEWYTGESVPYANDGFSIKKVDGGYSLHEDSFFSHNFFLKKLSNAKTVAQLIKNG